MHKAILFDLGKVLVHFDFKRAYAQLEPLCAHPAAEIPRLLAPTGLVERLETGKVDPRDFVSQVCALLNLRVDYDEFRRIFGCIFTDVLIPEEMLERLAQRYRLVLLSNTNAIHIELIEERY